MPSFPLKVGDCIRALTGRDGLWGMLYRMPFRWHRQKPSNDLSRAGADLARKKRQRWSFARSGFRFCLLRLIMVQHCRVMRVT